MDKLLYVAMSGAKETLAAQEVNNYNLANASTTGFKAALSAFQTRSVAGPGFASRAYATAGTVGWNDVVGEQQTTGNPLDVAVQGAGFIAIQDPAGKEAYTRAGGLHVDADGQLVTASERPVLSDSGPVAVPPASSVTIGADGTVSVVGLGQTPNSVASVGRIKLVNPPAGTLTRGPDGLYRTSDGTPAEADANVQLAAGVLESSNVNLSSCLVNMIELSRRFDLQVRALHTADEDAQSASKLLQSPAAP
ncbi:MAG TPA: flagellar basal body rod protein FlgF [Steroidobacteraceae bacterium]|nr:flagellar basal body rod protein FlgF [Steroidobacteraceae bacterium]